MSFQDVVKKVKSAAASVKESAIETAITALSKFNMHFYIKSDVENFLSLCKSAYGVKFNNFTADKFPSPFKINAGKDISTKALKYSTYLHNAHAAVKGIAENRNGRYSDDFAKCVKTHILPIVHKDWQDALAKKKEVVNLKADNAGVEKAKKIYKGWFGN